MKTSHKFWLTLGCLAVSADNIYLYCHSNNPIYHLGICFTLDFCIVFAALAEYLPRFNAWLNNEKYPADPVDKIIKEVVPLTKTQIALIERIIAYDLPSHISAPVHEGGLFSFCSSVEYTFEQAFKKKEINYDEYSNRCLPIVALRQTFKI